MNVHVLYACNSKQGNKISVCLSVHLTFCMSVSFGGTITYEGVIESKKNLVGVFYVQNVNVVLTS